MLKTANVVEGKIVRPFVVFLYAVNELGYLTMMSLHIYYHYVWMSILQKYS